MSNLANFITFLSLICGFASVIFSLENHFTFASWAILLSVIFDGLDGQVAKRKAVASEFGKELDSLVDVVSFGIAPALLGYLFVYKEFYFWATLTLFAYLICSIARLAKYNITPKEKMVHYFYGLPTTASGGILASFILIYRRYTQFPPPFIFLLLVLLVTVLMVSGIKYLNLEGFRRVFKKSAAPFLLAILVALLVVFVFYFITTVFLPELAIFTLFALYLIFSPLIIKKFV